MPRLPIDVLYTRPDAAALLGFKPQTLAKWAMDGKHLPIVHVGRSVRYRLSDLEKFMRQPVEESQQ